MKLTYRSGDVSKSDLHKSAKYENNEAESKELAKKSRKIKIFRFSAENTLNGHQNICI